MRGGGMLRYHAMEGVENAPQPSTAFPTPPTATTATDSLRTTHRFCGEGLNANSQSARSTEPPMTNAAEYAAEASELKTLDQMFRWATPRDPPLVPSDVIIQDEYTHDVIFRAA